MAPDCSDRLRAGHYFARSGNSGGAVYLFRLPQTPAYAIRTGFHLLSRLYAASRAMEIENFDVIRFLCGVIALSLLYAAHVSQTPPRRAESRSVPGR